MVSVGLWPRLSRPDGDPFHAAAGRSRERSERTSEAPGGFAAEGPAAAWYGSPPGRPAGARHAATATSKTLPAEPRRPHPAPSSRPLHAVGRQRHLPGRVVPSDHWPVGQDRAGADPRWSRQVPGTARAAGPSAFARRDSTPRCPGGRLHQRRRRMGRTGLASAMAIEADREDRAFGKCHPSEGRFGIGELTLNLPHRVRSGTSCKRGHVGELRAGKGASRTHKAEV